MRCEWKFYQEEDIAILWAVLKGIDITQTYSPERVTKLCRKYGLITGDSFDLRDGYDLSDPATQLTVVEKIQKTKPTLVIGSPPCTLFSRLQKLNLHVNDERWAQKFYADRKKAVGHILFCLRVFKLQRARGAYFLMEHPESADSWQIPELEEFIKSEGIMLSVADQCMYGLVTPSSATGEPTPAKKPTRFMSNSWCILHELSTRCDEGHTHQHLVGGRASKAQEYPDKLCRAICRGLANQKRYDEAGVVCTGGLSLNSLKAFANVNVRRDNCIVKPDGNVIIPDRPILDPWRQPSKNNQFPDHWLDCKHEPDGTAHGYIDTGDDSYREIGELHSGVNVGAQQLQLELDSIIERHSGYVECWDDVSGAPLLEDLLRAARDLEMDYFERMGSGQRSCHGM